jgi:hypothetical protein
MERLAIRGRRPVDVAATELMVSPVMTASWPVIGGTPRASSLGCTTLGSSPGAIVHETAYVTEAWEPPAWRAKWVEPMPAHAGSWMGQP